MVFSTSVRMKCSHNELPSGVQSPKENSSMRTSRRFSLFTTSASVAAVALLATACGGGGGGGEDGEESADFITTATGGSSGVYYQVGATMSEILADELGADTSVQSTGASVENLTLIEDGGAELAFTQGDAVDQALNAEGPFEGKGIESLPV